MAFEFDYCVSLSIVHPSVDPKIISSAINELRPDIETMAGDIKFTKQGTPVVPERKAKLSHWSARLHDEETLDSETREIADFLIDVLTPLNRHRELFAQLRQDGRVALRIGWFGKSNNSAGVLEAEALRLCGDLGIDIELDVYGAEPPLG